MDTKGWENKKLRGCCQPGRVGGVRSGTPKDPKEKPGGFLCPEFRGAEESPVHPPQPLQCPSAVLFNQLLSNTETHPPLSLPSPTRQWPENRTFWPGIKRASCWSLSSLSAHHFGASPKVKSILPEPFISQALGAFCRAVPQEAKVGQRCPGEVTRSLLWETAFCQ